MTQDPNRQREAQIQKRIAIGGFFAIGVLFVAIYVAQQITGGGAIDCSTSRDYVLNGLMALLTVVFCLVQGGAYFFDGSRPPLRKRIFVSVFMGVLPLLVTLQFIPCVGRFLPWLAD